MILDCGGKRSATPLWDRPSRCQSGVALRFPPQSKTLRLRLRRATGLASPTITHTTKGHLCGVAAQASAELQFGQRQKFAPNWNSALCVCNTSFWL
jgi:hypothetical protein